MTDKQIIIDGVDVRVCEFCDWKGSNIPQCRIRLASFETTCKGYNCYYKQLKRKEKEYEELRQYHNKCCEEFKNEKQELLEKYNQVSINFYNGDYCNTEHCSLLNAKEQECEELKKCLLQVQNASISLKQQLEQLKKEKEELKVMFKDLSYENQKLGYKIEEQTKQLEPFKDEYFKGLETIVIAELAKKSIRLTTENRKLENALDEIEEYINTHLDELAVNKIKDIINGAKDINVPHKAKE